MQHTTAVVLALLLCLSAGTLLAAPAPLPEGFGLAAKYPGDKGIEKDRAVVLAESFEAKDVAALKARWTDIKNEEGGALFLDKTAPAGSVGRHSLRVTATRGKNSGGYVFRVLKPGYDQLFFRFYVKFAEDYGFDHHFCSLSGEINPPPYPVGRAGIRPANTWGTGIEPTTEAPANRPSRSFAPPGIWHFYTYWPEMRSYENEDGTGTKCYGNDFEPETPVVAPRGRWICVEIMVKMNSAPEKMDGEQAMWIDGKLVGRFAPGTPLGYWFRDVYHNDRGQRGKPFEGMRWRHDMKVDINKVKLENYVSDEAFQRTEEYLRQHPDFRANAKESTVWFDQVVVSRKYVGPIKAR